MSQKIVSNFTKFWVMWWCLRNSYCVFAPYAVRLKRAIPKSRASTSQQTAWTIWTDGWVVSTWRLPATQKESESVKNRVRIPAVKKVMGSIPRKYVCLEVAFNISVWKVWLSWFLDSVRVLHFKKSSIAFCLCRVTGKISEVAHSTDKNPWNALLDIA